MFPEDLRGEENRGTIKQIYNNFNTTPSEV